MRIPSYLVASSVKPLGAERMPLGELSMNNQVKIPEYENIEKPKRKVITNKRLIKSMAIAIKLHEITILRKAMVSIKRNAQRAKAIREGMVRIEQ